MRADTRSISLKATQSQRKAGQGGDTALEDSQPLAQSPLKLKAIDDQKDSKVAEKQR